MADITQQEIFCRSVLTPEGWLADARVCIDSSGIITQVSGMTPGEKAGFQYGHLVPGMPNLHSHAFQRQMRVSMSPSVL